MPLNRERTAAAKMAGPAASKIRYGRPCKVGPPCILAIAGCCLCLFATISAAQEQPTYKGAYSNRTYNYSVTLPPGVEAKGSPPPNPNHGFTIDLAVANRAVRVYDKTDSFIAVEADYIPADGVQTLKDAVRFNMKASDEPQEVESESKASLGGLKAILVISHYRARGALMLHEQIIALGGRFIYSADLQTTPARRIVDEKLWTEIVRGFRVHQGKL